MVSLKPLTFHVTYDESRFLSIKIFGLITKVQFLAAGKAFLG